MAAPVNPNVGRWENSKHQMISLSEESDKRLERMRTEGNPKYVWPEGCYGSAVGWLVFVGPSPGGGKRATPSRARVMDSGVPLWDTPFLGPFSEWSAGFRASLKPLVETIVGLPLADGGSKLYTFVNFHWQQNPDATSVPPDGMQSGAAAVLSVLVQIRPRVIVAMEKQSYDLLVRTLKDAGYAISSPDVSALIDINDKGRAHRFMQGCRIHGEGPLSQVLVIRSPQHPARMYNRPYADRCARAIRSFTDQLLAGKSKVVVQERARQNAAAAHQPATRGDGS